MSKTILIPVQVPDWAKWVAQDEDGAWFAFSCKPLPGSAVWNTHHGSMEELCETHSFNPNWRETLREVA